VEDDPKDAGKMGPAIIPVDQSHRVSAVNHPRRRTSKAAAAEEAVKAAAEAADDSSELSDLDSAGDGEEVEDDFADVWARPVLPGTKGGGRYDKPEQEEVINYRQFCSLGGCVPVSYYELNFTQERFVMNNHGLGSAGAIALGKSLAENTAIKSITLRTNGIDEDAGEALVAACCANPNIVEMDLFENQLESDGFAAFAAAFAADDTMLRLLDLGRNDLLDFDALPFTAALKENNTLEVLALKGNKFGDFAAGGFSTMLQANNHLEELDLSENRIMKRGGIALATALGVNKSLKRFRIGGNGIGSDGGIAMAEAVAGNSTLEELYLDRCEIESAAAGVKLAELLQRNTSLKTLDIGHNRMPDAAIHVILEAWEAQPKGKGVTYLGLEGIDIDSKDQEIIKRCIADGDRNCSFKKKYSLEDTEKLKAAAKLRAAAMAERRKANEARRKTEHERRKAKQSAGSEHGGSEHSHGSRRHGSHKHGSGKKHKFKKRGSVVEVEDENLSRSERRARRESEHIQRRLSQRDDVGGGVAPKEPKQHHASVAEDDGELVSEDSTDPDTDDDEGVAQSNWRRDARKRRKWADMHPDLPDPMGVLEDYVSDMQLRLVDLFFAIDKDRSGGVSKSELGAACLALGLPLDDDQKEELMHRMDTDGDGTIDYHELCEGRRRFANKLHAQDPRWKTIAESSDEDWSSGSSWSGAESD
jgi:Ran GTPase-activating protein (RanGAP) involved in mRNA processing and transport